MTHDESESESEPLCHSYLSNLNMTRKWEAVSFYDVEGTGLNYPFPRGKTTKALIFDVCAETVQDGCRTLHKVYESLFFFYSFIENKIRSKEYEYFSDTRSTSQSRHLTTHHNERSKGGGKVWSLRHPKTDLCFSQLLVTWLPDEEKAKSKKGKGRSVRPAISYPKKLASQPTKQPTSQDQQRCFFF